MIASPPAPRRRNEGHLAASARRVALLVGLWSLTGAPAAAHGGPGDAGALDSARRALDAWQLEDARGVAERALRAHPDDHDARLLAAEVLHQRGQHDTAQRLLEDVGADHALGPAARARRAALAPLLEASAAAGAGGTCRETAHFRLCFVDKDDIVASYAEAVLEAAYAGIGTALKFSPAERDEKIAVEILPHARDLAGATGLHVREIETSGTIAVCRFHRLMVLSPLAVQHGYAWADTLAHEFVHLVVSKKTHNRVPVWLHEGLAKTLESRWRSNGSPRLEPHADALLRRAVEANELVPLARMHPSMAKLSSQQEASLAFAEVFSLVEHVVQREGMQAFVRLLDALGRGEPFDAALARTIAPLPALERRWRAALRAHYRGTHLAADATPPSTLRLVAGDGVADDKTSPRSPAADTERIGDANVRAVARLGELLAARGHAHAAARSFAAAHTLGAARYPSLSFALAQALEDDARPQEARKVLADAVARGQLADGADDGRAEAQWRYAALSADANACPEALRFLRAYNLRNPYRPEVHAVAARCHEKLGDAGAAARERKFAELAARPRPGAVTVPSAPVAAGRLTVLPTRWTPLRLDGAPPRPAPLWREPVAPGRHCALVDAAQASVATPACAEVGADEVAVLRP